jgi:hypothetical protein
MDGRSRMKKSIHLDNSENLSFYNRVVQEIFDSFHLNLYYRITLKHEFVIFRNSDIAVVF